MSLIQSSEANCKNCYRCIRSCIVKAIEFRNNQASVTENCIYCGDCIRECPQKAMKVSSDVTRVQFLLQTYDRIIVSLAPSYAGYEARPEELKRRLLDIGFYEVRETAEAAQAVSREYYAQYKEQDKLITTACPVIVELVEKQYPALLPYLSRTVSPMIAHAKMLKAREPHAKVVFIGPCYAKKKEVLDSPGFIDAVLTFDEIDKLNDIRNLRTSKAPEPTVLAPMTARAYPVEGGVIETTFHEAEKPEVHRAFSGIQMCQSVLAGLEKRSGSFFLELNACSGGCINGPVSGDRFDILEKQERVYSHMKQPDAYHLLPELPSEAFRRSFTDRQLPKQKHTEQEIAEVMEKFGKITKDDELNCGVCGYFSCREKAEAVLEGKAELYMCLPYMQAKAESLSNIIIDKTPNGIVAIGEDFMIREANQSICNFFEVGIKDLIDFPVDLLFNREEIVLEKVEKSINKIYFPHLQKTAMVTVSYLSELHLYLVILTDLTEREWEQEKLRRLKEETIDMAQKVIENQMRVSQEIASLLGETTAVTKVTLTKMKKLIEKD